MGAATSAVLLIAGAVTAGMQVASGTAKSREIKEQSAYNAAIYEQQAAMIEAQKGVESSQYDRAIRRMRSTAISRTAKSGLMLGGSPIVAMIDAETQMRFDQAIGQYNLDVRKNRALSGATETLRRGKAGSRTALMTGYTNAFTTLLTTAASANIGSGGAKSYATVKGMGKVRVAPTNYYLRAGKII